MAWREDLVLSSGYVSDEDLIGLYSSCHLFVFPSLHEGFGLPALEAMACGAAVIGSEATSIPEVIGREDALFNPLDYEQMAAMIERGLSDTEYWQSLRDHAAVQVPKFSWDATGKRALKAFEDAYVKRSERIESGATRPPKSSEERYRGIIAALTQLDQVSTDIDLVASADAIAANQREGAGGNCSSMSRCSANTMRSRVSSASHVQSCGNCSNSLPLGGKCGRCDLTEA